MLDGGADIAAVENIGAADCLTLGLQAGIGLYAAGNAIVAGAAAEGIDMNGDVVA